MRVGDAERHEAAWLADQVPHDITVPTVDGFIDYTRRLCESPPPGLLAVRSVPFGSDAIEVVVGDPNNPSGMHELVGILIHANEPFGMATAMVEIDRYANSPAATNGITRHYLLMDAAGGRLQETRFFRTLRPRERADRAYPRQRTKWWSELTSPGARALVTIGLEIADKGERLVSYRPLHNAHLEVGSCTYWDGPDNAAIAASEEAIAHGDWRVPIVRTIENGTRILHPGSLAVRILPGDPDDALGATDFEWIRMNYPQCMAGMIDTAVHRPKPERLAAYEDRYTIGEAVDIADQRIEDFQPLPRRIEVTLSQFTAAVDQLGERRWLDQIAPSAAASRSWMSTRHAFDPGDFGYDDSSTSGVEGATEESTGTQVRRLAQRLSTCLHLLARRSTSPRWKRSTRSIECASHRKHCWK
jgi:hypothetical protein